LYFIGGAIYNVFFHHLSKFPGLVLHRNSRIPYSYKCLRGTLPFDILDLHERFGDILRVAPDELAVADPNAWKDIMGYGAKEMEKAIYFFMPIEGSPANLVNEKGEVAKRLRRHLAPCFSGKATRDQQPLIKKYVDVFIDKLHEMRTAETPVNLPKWYNY
jgi:cytochrome P450